MGTFTAAATITLPSFDTDEDGCYAMFFARHGDDNNPTVTTAGWDFVCRNDVANSAITMAGKWVPEAGATGGVDVLLRHEGTDALNYNYLTIRGIR